MRRVYAKNYDVALRYIKKGYCISAISYFVDNGNFSYLLEKKSK